MTSKFGTKKLVKAGLIAVTALGLASGAMAADKIRIAAAGPHTGPNAAFGEQMRRGAEAAADAINAAGGITVKGKKKLVEIVIADDACEPKQAINVAQKLISSKIDAVVGHFCSATSIPASAKYQDAGVAMITPASTNPTLTEKKRDVVLRMCGRDDQQGQVIAAFILKNLKSKNIAVVHDKTTYGKGLADAARTSLKKSGGNVVFYEGITLGEKDFNALVTKMKSKKVDAVFFGGLHTEAGLLVKQMRELGSKAKFLSGDGIVSEQFVKAAGGNKNVNGVYNTFGADPRKIPASKKVVDMFKKGGYEPEGYTLYSYASVQALAKAIAATGTTDGYKIAKWLRDNGADTVMGKKAWNSKGDLKVSDYVVYQWDKNGKYSEVAH